MIIYKFITLLLFCIFTILPSSAIAVQSKDTPGDLNRVLSKMNEFGRSFRSLSANISQQKYIAILKEYEREEKGTFYYKRARDGSARMRKEIVQPVPNIVVIDGSFVTAYEPRLKQARRINLGKNKDKAEFLAIGIGQSPAKLEETFNLKLAGSETVEGRRTQILELTPKSAQTSAFFTKILLWIDEDRGVPLQQKFIEPNSDFTVVKFSNMKINSNLSDSVFKIKLPKGVEVIEQ